MAQHIAHVTNPLPTIALVGRVNVGKSTLFNKLTEDTKAIVSDVPGTTRTSNEGIALWRGQEIRVIDTGGLTFDEAVPLEEDILRQSERAMKVADLILFVTDGNAGVLPQERELAKRLRRVEVKPVVLVANKVDTSLTEQTLTEPEWYGLGLGEPFPISAANGRNIGDLLDHIFTLLEHRGTAPIRAKKEEAKAISVSLIGKPNVGKSSLFNKLIGEDRVIVSEMAHTTREPYDTLVTYYPQGMADDDAEETNSAEDTLPATADLPPAQSTLINFIDTAGIRRKARVYGKLEREGIFKSIDSLGRSDVILYVIDGSQPISSQDMQLGGLIERHSKSVIILLNKWDLSEDTSQTAQTEAKKMVYAHFPHLNFAEVLLVSGKTGYNVHKIFPLILRVWQARQTHIANRALEKFLEQATKEHRPARGKGTRHPKLLGMRQINTAPPVFELFVKYRTSLHRSYINFLENKLRDQFDFLGTPIVIKLTKVKRE